MTKSLPPSIAIVSNSDTNIYRFRAPIMLKLLELGVRVYAVAPPGRFVSDIESMGVEFVPWNLNRRSLNPFLELRSLIDLVMIYRRLRPDMAQHFTVKPNVYGAIAARVAGVPLVFGGVTGLGTAFASGGTLRPVLRSSVRLLYRLATALSDRMTFQTEHDARLLYGESGAKKALVIRGGSSVNLATYNRDSVPQADRERIKDELGIGPGDLVVTMASRLLYDKGVSEYVEASRALNSKRSDTHFVLAGDRDPGNRDSVTSHDLEKWADEGSILYVGYRDDMPALLAASDIVVLPTYYPEGIPRVLIEAAAMGTPIVSTTIPGVAEIVEDGVNGSLVPPRDAVALASAIEMLLDNPRLRSEYGEAGRRKAEREYDDRQVAQAYVEEYKKAWMKAVG